MQDANKVIEIIENIEKVILGKRNIIELVIIALICEGHVLIEDVPGVGKTLLVSSVAKSIDASFKRIQFTPDVLPSDITGFSIYNQKSGDFEYRAGAIMSNIILADEINRTSPKTQSSLLEAMEEKQVTVDGMTFKLNAPFMVLATQNPVEYLGTYPLPEAQIDRFLMKVKVGYPSITEEIAILSKFKTINPIDLLKPVATSKDIINLQNKVKLVHVDHTLSDYIVQITSKTRTHDLIELGASVRGSMSLFRAAQGKALCNGRNFVIPDDIKGMIEPVLAHRIVLNQEAKLKGITTQQILEDITRSVHVPVVNSHVKK